jgi:alkyl sulfatase BDS1-like metallo-beta-lactamase superfamily hydrolase
LSDTVKPLQDKRETIYVVKGSDAEAHVTKRFPHKTAKRVGNSLRPRSIRGFLDGLSIVFQRKQATGLDATYHFTFEGKESARATVSIRDGRLTVSEGHARDADLRLWADSATWLGFLAKERNLLWALLRRKIRIRGNPKLLLAFGRCFLG